MAGGHVKYRALSRNSAHRQALLRNLVTSLFKSEAIQTTWHKAKEAQRLADKLVTLGKRNTEASKRVAHGIFFTPEPLVEKLFGPIRERYLHRPGGYTRVLRIESPKEDQAPSAILEFVDGPNDMRFNLTAKTVARQRGMAVARESAERANAQTHHHHHHQTSTIFSNNNNNSLSDTTNTTSTSTSTSENKYNYTGITPITALNIKKVTQFRPDGLAQFDRLVRNFEQHQHFEHVLTGDANGHYRYHQAFSSSSSSAATSSSGPDRNGDSDGDGDSDSGSSNHNQSPFQTQIKTQIKTKPKPGSSPVPSTLTVLTKLNSRPIERRVEREALTKKRVYPVQVRDRMSKKGRSRADRAQQKKEGERLRKIRVKDDELDDLWAVG